MEGDRAVVLTSDSVAAVVEAFVIIAFFHFIVFLLGGKSQVLQRVCISHIVNGIIGSLIMIQTSLLRTDADRVRGIVPVGLDHFGPSLLQTGRTGAASLQLAAILVGLPLTLHESASHIPTNPGCSD